MKLRILSVAAILGIAAQTGFAADNAAAQAATFTPAQTTAIQKIVHDYLVQHPEVLVEASQALQAKGQKMMEEQVQKTIPRVADQLLKDTNAPAAGNPKASVTVVEFFDYQCPHCKAMGPEIDKLLAHDKDVRVVYKEFPIFGANSEFAARAALAAQKQGKFQVFHDALLKSQVQEGQLTNQTVLDIAKSVGLDVNKLQADMNQPALVKEIQDNMMLGQQLGIRGTPMFIVLKDQGGKVVSRIIPGQTDDAGLTKVITEVRATK